MSSPVRLRPTLSPPSYLQLVPFLLMILFANCSSAPCPIYRQIAPIAGPAGSRVVISGSDFTDTTAVTFFGGIPAQFTIDNGSSITATVPSAAVTGAITIRKGRCSEVETHIFTVTKAALSKAGLFRSGYYWLLDVDNNGQLNNPPDREFAFGGVQGDLPIVGDWNGDRLSNVGIYRPRTGDFITDSDGDEKLTSNDKVVNLGVGTQPGDVPVVGDWNGDGRSELGLFRKGYLWILDFNGDGVFDQTVDKTFTFGGTPGDLPVVGAWTAGNQSRIGIVRNGFLWILDANGNGVFDGADLTKDFVLAFGGIPGDVPMVGDWNGDGVTEVGVFRNGFLWVLDVKRNGEFDGTGPGKDRSFPFGGIAGDKPVVGQW